MTRWITYASIVGLGLAAGPRLGRAEPATAPVATAADEPAAKMDELQSARSLYHEGAEQYRQGRYREALERFEAAHRLAPSPVLLFNIAQSHRNLGECQQALQAYREYLRVRDDEPSADQRRPAAGIHVANLDLVCGGAAAALPRDDTAPRVVSEAAPADTGQATTEPGAHLRRIGWTGLISASVLGATAGGLYLWNSSRVDRLGREDRRLDQDPSLSGEDVQTGSARNEKLRQSIGRVDNLTIGAAVLGGVAALISAVAFSRARVPAEVRVACHSDCAAGLTLPF